MGLEYPGAIYQVLNRGNRCGDIVQDNLDRRCFVNTQVLGRGQMGHGRSAANAVRLSGK
jgi:hypothetical protein